MTNKQTEAITILGKGPNDPAMMLCAKLAEYGVVVKISTMRKALASTPQEPDDAGSAQKCSLTATASSTGEAGASNLPTDSLVHDLRRVMTRENTYLNALLLISGMRGRAAEVARRALYGDRPHDDPVVASATDRLQAEAPEDRDNGSAE